MLLTFHTRLEDNEFYQDMATLFCGVMRQLFIKLKTEHINKISKDFQKKYKINRRHFGSISYALKTEIKIKEGTLTYNKKLLKIRIEKIKQKIKKTKNEYKLHHLKRKLHKIECKLENAKLKIIFGSKKLWKEQFKENTNHEEWKQKWQQARHNQFSFIGSKDEPNRNQNCQLKGDKLFIRVPEALEHKYGTHFIINNVKFKYGQDVINYALTKNKQPIFYQFVKKEKGWYLCLITESPKVDIITSKANGALGLDINPNEIGYARCDGEGNLKQFGTKPYNIGKQTQTKDKLSIIVKELVGIAVKNKTPICIEKLDFVKKKAEVKGKYARMLNGFAYNTFKSLLLARAYKYGVQVIECNPAYSSIIGVSKFMSQYGMNSASAAALVMARRCLWKSERVPSKYAFLLPVDNKKHAWSWWRKFLKKSTSAELSRHSFFNRGTNSPVMSILTVDKPLKKGRKVVGKSEEDVMNTQARFLCSNPSQNRSD